MNTDPTEPGTDDVVADDPGAEVLTNGARYYVDHAHPEYSTPECADVWRGRLDGQGSWLLDLEDQIASLRKALGLFGLCYLVNQLITIYRVEALENRPLTPSWTENRILRLEQALHAHINPKEYTHHEP